ncbi:hypothetical protein OZX73_08500 [Bifidobacterium sp. ESL0775]|uniref:hypothetical protein n=1 Tax=Bifidobacterium sp. ESL0775 TaxID=2983230 RepID=UPI0023F800C7|nr:hypothetical protein [Bifidobacterium sp. ESL0775]WEV69281.1 hypothetical protein OZX73_08500 [Bifidobacterium sp. ESL0775]
MKYGEVDEIRAQCFSKFEKTMKALKDGEVWKTMKAREDDKAVGKRRSVENDEAQRN